MKTLSKGLVAFVALEHLFILWIEMFAWTTFGSKVFSVFPGDFFTMTTAMAANQGLYNGFLAAGLIWALLVKDRIWNFRLALFFLSCVGAAALFGAATIQTKIILTQGVPAFIALIVLFLNKNRQ
ncbi:MAG: DUF1304 domain-containing protein [Spirochaetales bacterium]|nr:DUF1304 domain-containing protein [Spirochaetales bacterium]